MKTALLTIATKDYNGFIKDLATSNHDFFGADLIVFTDRPDEHKDLPDTKAVKIKSFGWPEMPLLRFECFYELKKVWEEYDYVYMIDADALFVEKIELKWLHKKGLIGVLHRNLSRYRDQYNYENRPESSAYMNDDEGEKYFACGFTGGSKDDFEKLSYYMSSRIRSDISMGMRALWGDESHINKYFALVERPYILPPSFMCPENSPYFKPIITHQNKTFKSVYLEDAKEHTEINSEDYRVDWHADTSDNGVIIK